MFWLLRLIQVRQIESIYAALKYRGCFNCCYNVYIVESKINITRKRSSLKDMIRLSIKGKGRSECTIE